MVRGLYAGKGSQDVGRERRGKRSRVKYEAVASTIMRALLLVAFIVGFDFAVLADPSAAQASIANRIADQAWAQLKADAKTLTDAERST